MMTKIAFVRKKEIPPSAPPITEVGLIGWLRQNLFSSWLNSILTVLSVYFIVIILWDFIPWAYGGHWNTKSLRECLDLDPDVACFSVLTARWKQLLFGLYPAEEYWRPTCSNIISKVFSFFLVFNNLSRISCMATVGGIVLVN